MRVKTSKQPPPPPTTSAVGPCPTVIQIVGRPGTGSLPSTIAPPDHPQCVKILQELIESKPKAYPKHKKAVLSLHSTTLPISKLMCKDTSGTDRIRTQSLS